MNDEDARLFIPREPDPDDLYMFYVNHQRLTGDNCSHVVLYYARCVWEGFRVGARQIEDTSHRRHEYSFDK